MKLYFWRRMNRYSTFTIFLFFTLIFYTRFNSYGTGVVGNEEVNQVTYTQGKPNNLSNDNSPQLTSEINDAEDASLSTVAFSNNGCSGNAPGSADPAAVYCTELGYEYKIIKADAGEYGVCVFPDNTGCSAWDFLKGSCGEKHSYCAKQGYESIIKTDGKNPYSREYVVCKEEENEIGNPIILMDLESKITKGTTDATEIIKTSTIQTSFLLSPPPSLFDWRDYNGGNWMTPVKAQGICGSCWAFAVIGAVEAQYDIASNNPDLNLDLSEQYLVSDCHSNSSYENCCGGYKDVALDFIRDEGVVDEDCMNYVDGTGCSCSGGTCDPDCNYNTGENCSDTTCSDKCVNWQDSLKTITEWGRLI